MLPMTLNKIAQKLNCSSSTARIYLSRSEFSHIKVVTIKRKTIYKGLTKDDFIRLDRLINRRRAIC